VGWHPEGTQATERRGPHRLFETEQPATEGRPTLFMVKVVRICTTFTASSVFLGNPSYNDRGNGVIGDYMRKGIRRALLGVFIVLLGAGLWAGYQVYSVYNDVNAAYHAEPRISPEPKATPVTDFFGNHRINFLVLGSDNDLKAEEKHPLTQSMIVVSVDPVHDKVNMVSIPRDFWVPIPGHGMGKIDLAAKYGWVPLARATVEKLFHINIDYYAWVGLNGFSSVVNDFNGITINVTHPILDDFYPNDQIPGDPYAYTRVFIPPGWRHLSGRQALQYVRSRHGDAGADFGRSERQQQILLQLRSKADGWNLVFKIPQLAHDLKNVVRTDLSPTKLFDLARLARHIHSSDITHFVLSAPTYCQYSTKDGQSVLLPNWRAIRPVIRRMFAPIQGSSPPPTPVAHATATVPTTVRPTPAPKSKKTSRVATATPRPAPPALTRLPGKLFYIAGGTIYEMDRTGHVTDIMPPWMTAADMPAVSPDGKTVAFMRWSTFATDLYTYSLVTHQIPTQITNDASPDPHIVNNYTWAAWPAWSPDGKTILFSSDRYKLQRSPSEARMLDLAIYAANPDGSNLRQLTIPATGAGGDTDPQFRGKSSQYLYDHWAYVMRNGLAIGQPYSQLMIRDLNNPNAVRALTPSSGQIVQPALDRSGTRLAYVHVQANGRSSRLVVARIVDAKNGPQLRDQKTILSGEIAQPAFSPDGRWISYLQAEGDGFSIFMKPLRGGPPQKLDQAGTGVDAISRPIWVP